MNAALLLTLLLASAPPPPDTSTILRLIGRFSVGHACPVAADVALTAAHVTDMAPFEMGVPLWPYRYEGGGGTGVVVPTQIQPEADLGVMRPLRPFARWYRQAAQAPVIGERLWALAYQWKSRKELFADRVVSGRVTRVVAGSIVLDEDMPQGASGSCVLNAAGEVVGLVVWGWRTEDHKTSAVVVGTWGDWAPVLK